MPLPNCSNCGEPQVSGHRWANPHRVLTGKPSAGGECKFPKSGVKSYYRPPSEAAETQTKGVA